MLALRDTESTMLALRPEIVIFSHGDCFHEDATARLSRALGWALPARLRAAAG